MSETTTDFPTIHPRLHELEQASSPLDFYLKLLGEPSLPASPDQMPDVCVLPSGFSLPIAADLRKSSEDLRERSGTIRWDPKSKKLISRHFEPGTKTQTTRGAPTLLHRNHPIVAYHIHPGNSPSMPSIDDMGSFVIFTPFIELVASNQDYSAVFATRQSKTRLLGKLPGALRLTTNQEQLFTNDQMADLAQEHGLAYYYTHRAFLKPEDRIVLTRVKPQLEL